MRILKILLTSLLGLAMLTAVVFFVAREVLLAVSVYAIETNLNELKFINRNQATYIQKCRLKGYNNENASVRSIQLRFTSPRDYQTEVVCDQFPNDPIILKTGSLAPFVMKKAGYSGIIWGDNASGVVLSLWGRQYGAGVVAQNTVLSAQFTPDQLQPATTCSGFSQLCCLDQTQQGVGQENSAATDCVQSCFTSCQARPVVLSFTTDPFYDQNTRILHANAGDTITFAYLASSGQVGTSPTPAAGAGKTGATAGPQPTVQVSYGDGQQDTNHTLTGQFTHAYTCPQAACSFTVTVKVTDPNGVVSAMTPVSTITVQIP